MKETLLREGIVEIIRDDHQINILKVASELHNLSGNPCEAMPDVFLIYTNLSDECHLNDILFLKQKYCDSRFLLLLKDADNDVVIQAISAGITGLLLENLIPHQLKKSIHDIYHGHYILSDMIVRMLVERIPKHSTKLSTEHVLADILQKHNIHMPKTHIKIATSLLKGGTTKSIAQSLRMSENTVRKYISDWIKELNVQNRNDVIEFLNNLLKDTKLPNKLI